MHLKFNSITFAYEKNGNVEYVGEEKRLVLKSMAEKSIGPHFRLKPLKCRSQWVLKVLGFDCSSVQSKFCFLTR